jgi:para-nitrobenzyl esterase
MPKSMIKPKDAVYVFANTKYGKAKGEYRNGVFVWKGLPYAQKPIGDRRFMEPLPIQKWKGVYNATYFRPSCLQMVFFEKEIEDEDCLYLNIYSPSIIGKKPVMVFIHGGAFIAGSSSQYLYDGTNICKKGVVVVTINYRLGALSMFNFSYIDKQYSSNLALKDQLMALAWVYENIAAFGGDPEDITICGQSAGAISVLCLLSVEQARKYIKKAVAISPLPDFVNSYQRSVEIAQGFLNYLDIRENEFYKLVQMDAFQLNRKAREYTKSFEERNGLNLLMPVVDGEFLKHRPLKSAKEGKAFYPPLIIGVTKNEADILFKLKPYKDKAKKDLNSFFESENEIKDELLNAYGTSPIDQKYAQILGDLVVGIPLEWYGEFHSQFGDVWFYRFEYSNLFLELTGLKSAHALDIIFAFGNFNNIVGKLLFSLTPFRKKAYELSQRLGDDLTYFINNGKAPWQKKRVKVYDKDGDFVEEKDCAIRDIWKKTNLYKTLIE